jgi:hypothetical protein
MDFLNYLWNVALSYLQQKKYRASTHREEANQQPSSILQKSWEQFNKQQIYSVNVIFNQRKSKIPPQFRKGNGLEEVIRRAQKTVQETPALIPNFKKRKQFLRQNPKRVAKYLCNTVSKWQHLFNIREGDMPALIAFYILGINNNGIVWKNRMFARQDEEKLLAPYCDYGKTVEFSERKGHTPSQIVAGVMRSKHDEWCFRIRTGFRKGHTFRGVCHEGEIIMYDTFHTHWSGRPLSERKCILIYGYRFVRAAK